ncbi:Histone chaperone RTT106 [Paramyrothecium foliicola]|nr:Histone chaperone RTT106 [Paramyrothecium foliicola]
MACSNPAPTSSTASGERQVGAQFPPQPPLSRSTTKQWHDNLTYMIDSPGRIALFNEITSYVQDQLQTNGEPALKRRRVDNGAVNGAAGSPAVLANAADEPVLLEIKEISVAVPQRKKFEICFTAQHIYARAPGTTAPIPAITYAWSDIEYAFYLPVPDKAQVQHNYVLFPRGTCIPSKANPPTVEPLVFTVPATPPKQGTIGGSEAGNAAAVSDTYKSLFHWAFDRRLKGVGSSVTIVSANPNKFHSMIRQAHRPNEKAVHVTGFRGSKDGFLFFLENGIFWGFKKPLMFMPLDRIVAVSYTNILQITFNIVVEVMSTNGEPNEELEFGMLDQQDYGGIDDYIKTNRLQDRSMAEQRKGKLQLAENRKKAAEGDEGDGANGHEGGNSTSELALAHLEAEQLLQDEEDEDEEDYDPGSEGDSEGSGESSGDDDDDDDDEDDEEEDEDEEGGEDDAEGEEDADEEVEPQEEIKEEKVVQPPPAAAPARWAAFTSRPSRKNQDAGEKFDVV